MLRCFHICISPFAGIFIPETRRYYLTSHLGLWRFCRYTVEPTKLANSSEPQNFTTFSLTNITQINALKKTIAEDDPFILHVTKGVQLPDRITNIDNDFRQLMFAHWILDHEQDFKKLKSEYKRVGSPTNVSAVREIVESTLSPVTVNGSQINVIVPKGLQNALFADWEDHRHVLPLLGQYAKELEIPIFMANSNRTQDLIQPPLPPEKGKVANGYVYNRFGWLMIV